MPYYDPAMEVLYADLLAALDPQPGDPGLGYIEVLRRVQTALLMCLADAEMALEPDDEQTCRTTLGHLDAKHEDRWLAPREVLQRLQAAVDIELSRWTSGLVQVPGPSGAAVVVTEAT